jgi:hypothetical protein
VTTASSVLNMNNGSTTSIGTSSSFVNSPMNYDMALNGTRTLNFPVGKNNDWRPAVLSVTHNNGTSYTYNAEVFNLSAATLSWSLPPTVTKVSDAHYWDLDRTLTSTGVNSPTANLSGNAVITLYYGVNDFVTDAGNLVICKNTYNAPTAWINIGGTGASNGSGSISSTSSPGAFNSFSRFSLGNQTGGVNPLPVELISFSGTLVHGRTELLWYTSYEFNNHHFDVERSDGNGFEKISEVPATNAITGDKFNEYRAVDESPLKGLSYYRLRQVDKSGKTKYSSPITVDNTDNIDFALSPNPAQDRITITIENASSTITAGIYNEMGQITLKDIRLSRGTNEIFLGKIPAGIYLLRFSDPTMKPVKLVLY